MLNVSLVGDKELIGKLDAMPSSVQSLLVKKAYALSIKLQAHIVNDKLHGQVLNQKSGALARSIQQTVDEGDLQVYGRVYSSGDVKYAAIHEFGGLIKHPGGTAYFYDTKAQAIRFLSNAAAADIAWPLPRTAAHNINMPERSFMRTGLADMAAEISMALKQAVIDGLKASLAA